jgi:hypothetical protein
MPVLVLPEYQKPEFVSLAFPYPQLPSTEIRYQSFRYPS